MRLPSKYLLMKCGTGQFLHFENEFQQFSKDFNQFSTQTFIFPMLFKQCISKNLGRNSFKHYKKVFVEQSCIKVLEKRVVKETKSSFAIKFEFQHFWLKSSFPQNAQKISLPSMMPFQKWSIRDMIVGIIR